MPCALQLVLRMKVTSKEYNSSLVYMLETKLLRSYILFLCRYSDSVISFRNWKGITVEVVEPSAGSKDICFLNSACNHTEAELDYLKCLVIIQVGD